MDVLNKYRSWSLEQRTFLERLAKDLKLIENNYNLLSY